MFSEIYYSKKTGEPVQVVAKCSILPDEIPGICFQQMSGEFECFVWDVEHFKANYQKEKIEKIKKEEPAQREEISDLVRFLSLDLSLEDGVDGYSFLMSELKIRSRFEGKRGERL